MSCEEFKPLITNAPFLMVVCSQALAGAVSMFVGAVTIRKCRKLHFHVNCKILITSLLLLYVAHSICITLLQTLQLVRYLLHKDPCKAAIPSAICFSMRFPATICMTSFSLLQLGMITERAVALWKRKRYENQGKIVGYSIAACCMITSVVLTTWTLIQMNLHMQTVYCSAGTAETAFRVRTLSFILCGIDLTTLSATAIVFILNEVASSYQLSENANVIRVISPLSVFQSVCHASFCISNAVISTFESKLSIVAYRTLFAGTYIIPYYTLVAPILLLLTLKWFHQKRVTKLKVLSVDRKRDKDMYFNTYLNMWMTNDGNKS